MRWSRRCQRKNSFGAFWLEFRDAKELVLERESFVFMLHFPDARLLR
jgi:hypothetical protein